MKTNRTPWTDKVKLISVAETADNDGYITTVETETEIFCTITDGVVRSEFYEAMKAGITLTAQCEIYEAEYDGQKLLDYGSKRFDIVRVFPSGYGTLFLSLSEVIR